MESGEIAPFSSQSFFIPFQLYKPRNVEDFLCCIRVFVEHTDNTKKTSDEIRESLLESATTQISMNNDNIQGVFLCCS